MFTGTDNLAEKVVLLGGATGEVGGAVALALRQRGARIAAAVRSPRQVAQLAEALGSDGVLVGSVGAQDGEAAAGFAKGAADALGPIDALICAHGAFAAAEAGQDPAGALAGLLEANLLAPATLARAVVGPMKRRRAGSLVFVGSAAVGSGGRGMTNYLASKAALHEYVRALAHELDGSGLRAVALLPRTIDTPANRQAMPDADRSAWTPLAEVADALLQLAFGPLPPGGPLYRLPLGR
jgi:NAD(P)-dependent dehydrogenase (short-subunit alcohol dehydrogenase family)